MFQYQFCCARLKVWWVTVFSENALHHDSDLRAGVFTFRPVNGVAPLNGLHQLLRNQLQRVVSENSHSAVVHFQGVVESDLVIGEPQDLAAFLRFPHLLGELDKFLYNFRCLDGAVLA